MVSGSNTLWISSIWASCSFSFSDRKPPSSASGGTILLITRASTFLLYKHR